MWSIDFTACHSCHIRPFIMYSVISLFFWNYSYNTVVFWVTVIYDAQTWYTLDIFIKFNPINQPVRYWPCQSKALQVLKPKGQLALSLSKIKNSWMTHLSCGTSIILNTLSATKFIISSVFDLKNYMSFFTVLLAVNRHHHVTIHTTLFCGPILAWPLDLSNGTLYGAFLTLQAVSISQRTYLTKVLVKVNWQNKTINSK